MNSIVKMTRRSIALALALLSLAFAVLPSNQALAEDGGKINTGG
jgi:hypothetical protein